MRFAARAPLKIAPVSFIAWFAGVPSHPFVPLGRRPVGARSAGQGRPTAGASRAPLTAASTLAGWRRSGVGAVTALAVATLISGAPLATALAQDTQAVRSAAVHPYAEPVADAARRFGIPETWVWAVMRVESNGDARAVSTAGAMGLMQIMPATWTELRARYGLGTDPYDVRDNIMAGAAYLREMFDRYGDTTAMLAAYNAGPGRYDEHLSRGRRLPAETRAYLAKLAAIVGSTDNTRLAAAPPPDQLAWRSAALFSVRSGDIRVAEPTTTEMVFNAQSEPPTGDQAVRAITAASPQRDSLFVPLSGRRPQ